MAASPSSDMPDAANVGAQLVAPLHPFDEAALAAYLRVHVADFRGPLELLQFQGGQSNPTYRVTAGDHRYVLRRKPPGKLLPSAHAVDREHRVMAALAGTGVPVARMIAMCDDPAVIGTPFYLMQYVEGRVLWDPTLPGMTPPERGAHYDELNRVLATLHRVDYAAVGLADFGKSGQYIERQISRWSKQYEAAPADRIPAMDALIGWLPRHVPAGDETSIVHGDYRIDNVIFHPTEPRVLAVLDWELATLGHPLSDFAYHAMAWRLAPGAVPRPQGLRLRRARYSDRSRVRRRVLRAHGPLRHPALGVLPDIQHVSHRGDPARRARPRAAGQRGLGERARAGQSRAACRGRRVGNGAAAGSRGVISWISRIRRK